MEKNKHDMKFVRWFNEAHGQNVHPVTARKAFWENPNPQKYEQAGIDITANGYSVVRDPIFKAARDYSAFDRAIPGLQESVGYSTSRNVVIYKNGEGRKNEQ